MKFSKVQSYLMDDQGRSFCFSIQSDRWTLYVVSESEDDLELIQSALVEADVKLVVVESESYLSTLDTVQHNSEHPDA